MAIAEVVSRARVDYSVRLAQTGTVRKTAFSNTVRTLLTDDILSAQRQVSKTASEVYDVLDYTVTLQNLTPFVLTDLVYREEGGGNLLTVPGSLRIDGRTAKGLDPLAGFTLPRLSPKGTLTIAFSAVLLPRVGETVRTRATLDFVYPGTPLLPIQVRSDETATTVAHALFRLFHVGQTLPLPGGTAADVTSVQTRSKRLSVKLCKTALKRLPHRPDMPVTLLLSDGVARMDVGYDLGRDHLVAHLDYGFRGGLFVPQGVRYCPLPDPKLEVTDVSYEISPGQVFFDLAVLMSI